MEHAAGARAHLLQDREHVIQRAPLVDHDREAHLVGERDLGAEPALLVRARRVVAEEVEPGLADRDHARVRARDRASASR